MITYWCGWPLPIFAELVFSTAREWIPHHSNHKCVSNVDDILVYGAHGPCRCDPHLFTGRILSVNGEDSAPKKYTSRTMQIGAGGMSFPYGAVEWLNQNFNQYMGPVKHYAVAYANSNCVKERESMIKELSKYVPVHAHGRCTGMGSAKLMRKSLPWQKNYERLKGYAFIFAAEHGQTLLYVTEKPFVAVAAGAVPIYWGDSVELKKFMNPQRILVWNESTAQIVKKIMFSNQIRNLIGVNRTDLIKKAKALIPKLMAL